MYKMNDLPPIIPKPGSGSGRDVFRETCLQRAIQVEVCPPRNPIYAVFGEISRCFNWKRHWKCAVFGIAGGSLVCVMDALERMAGDDLDVHFVVIVFVEECAVTCASDRARSHCSANAAVENVQHPI